MRVSGLLLAPEGWAHEEKGQELIPWTEFAGVKVASYQGLAVLIYRNKDGKPKMASRVTVDLLRAWVIPPLVDELVRRHSLMA